MTKNIPGFSWKQQKLQTFRASSKPTVSSWCWPRSLDILRTFSATQPFFFAASSEVEATKSPLKTKVVSSRPDSETDKMGQNGLQKVCKSRKFQQNELILTWNRWKPFTMLPGQACRRHESREASECTAVWNETLANSFKESILSYTLYLLQPDLLCLFYDLLHSLSIVNFQMFRSCFQSLTLWTFRK